MNIDSKSIKVGFDMFDVLVNTSDLYGNISQIDITDSFLNYIRHDSNFRAEVIKALLPELKKELAPVILAME